MIGDFELPDPKKGKPLTRPTVKKYEEVAEAVSRALDKDEVPLITADMGWGKTTHFIAQLAKSLGVRIIITMPNKRLA